MGLTTAVEESLTKTITQAVAFSEAALWVSLHSANPGSTGTNEVTSGVSTAGRQLPTFVGSAGSDTATADLAFALVAMTATWIGYWTAQTGGTFLGGFPLVRSGTVLAASSGVAVLTAPSHGRAVNDIVRLFTIPGSVASAVPAGFTADTHYYVVAAPDTDHLSLSATLGGTAIATGSPGACSMHLDQGVYSATGTLTFPGGSGLTYLTTS
jgi:hypothetical protein